MKNAQRLAAHTQQHAVQMLERMQMLAVLSEPAETSGGDIGEPMHWEVLLCEVRAMHNGHIVEVQPPFVDSHIDGYPYVFELPSGAWYEYAIENASHVPTDEERRAVREEQYGFEATAPQMRRNLAGAGFEPLVLGCVARCAIVGEIEWFDPEPCAEVVSGKANSIESDNYDWEAEALLRSTTPSSLLSVFFRSYYYILYELSLPVDGEWEVHATSERHIPVRSRMCTHCASLSGSMAYRRRCVFNQPLELHISQRHKQATINPLETPDPLPARIVLQVMCMGSWGRQMLHGYGYVDLPRKPGCHMIKARLWRPLGAVQERLSADFCGSHIPLAAMHLVASADLDRRNGLPRNRSDLRATTAAGMVQLRLHVLLQEGSAGTGNLQEAREKWQQRRATDDDKTSHQLLRRRNRGAGKQGRTSRSPSPTPTRS